jgi:hypothetical protein
VILGSRLVDGVHHVFGGAVKAFGTYLIPSSILARKLKGNFQRAAAVAVAVGLVRLVDRSILELESDEASWMRKYRWALAGALGAGVGLLLDRKLCDSSAILFWSMIRAARCYMPEIPHGSTLGICFSAGTLLSAYLVNPDEVDPAYVRFVNRQTGRTAEMMAKLRLNEGPTLSTCGKLHPGISCTQDKLNVLPGTIFRAIKVYAPLYLVLFAFSKKRNLSHLFINITRSTAFLSACCMIAWSLLCFSNKIKLPFTRIVTFSWLFFSGLAALFERESRRKELAVYSLTYTFESLYKRAIKYNLAIKHPLLNWIIVAICSGLILHNNNQQPAFLMNWLFKCAPNSDHQNSNVK